MKKFLSFLFALFLVIIGSVRAEEIKGPMNGPHKLLPIPIKELGWDKNIAKNVLCGPYLVMIPASESEGRPRELGYVTEVWAPPSHGGKKTAWIFLPHYKFRIVIEDLQEDVTAEIQAERKTEGAVKKDGDKFYVDFNPDDIKAVVLRMSWANISDMQCVSEAKRRKPIASR